MTDEPNHPQPPAILHIHGPRIPHDDAHIRANFEGLNELYRLIHQINDAHRTNHSPHPTTGSTEAFTADGEGFTLHLELDTSDWQSGGWQGAKLPYTDEAFAGSGEGGTVPHNRDATPTWVVRWAAEECERQGSGEVSVFRLVEAWHHLREIEGRGLDIEVITAVGALVAPAQNTGTQFLRTTVSNTLYQNTPPGKIRAALDDLLQEEPQDPAEWYATFEEIYPLTNGNERVGALLYNFLKGTLETPDHPPDFHDKSFWETRRGG